jgi:hypothetical protein
MIRLVLCGALTLLLWQAVEPRDQRIRLALATPEPTAEQLKAVNSARIDAALRSPDALWAFVTAPEPSYLERRAAAYQAKGVVPVTWLPKIWAAIGELRREEREHGFGLKPHPLSSLAWTPSRAPARAVRQILGHSWTAPVQPLDYPLTPSEREEAPWLWQVREALRDLNAGLIPRTYAPLERADADAYLSAVLAMPCGTDDEAQWLVEAAQGSSHYKTPAIMGALRNIATNPRLSIAAIHVGTTYADATRLWNDPRSWALGAAGLVDVLRNSPHVEARKTAAYSVRSLREAFVDGATRRQPLPAAVILELSRLALDPSAGDDWTRLYVYAFSVVEALDEPPFEVERGMAPLSPDVARRLSDFAGWLERNRRGLEDLAASQKPAIDEASAMLASIATCRAMSPRGPRPRAA